MKFGEFINKSPREVTHKDIRNYLLYLISKQKSSSTINLVHNALNLYYGTILRKRVKDIPFQKRKQAIKPIASREQIVNMINQTKNLKHKLVISLLYSTGLRVSELIKLKVEHLNFKKKLVFVKGGKGNKDRFTIVSELLTFQIQDYLKTRPYQSDFLFASRQGHITARTVQEIVKQASRKVNLKLSPHCLRHSFATHLTDQGTKIEFIGELLGHKDIRTTRQYQRLSTNHLEQIENPYDQLIG